MRHFITYHNIRLKSYLNLSYDKINSPTWSRKQTTILAIAINDLKQNLIKKIRVYGSLALLTSTFIPSSIITFQCRESPCFNSNNFNISCGITDLVELGPPLLNFVVYSKIGIPPFMLFMYYILYLLRYIYLPFTKIFKGYYNNLYILEVP